MLENKLGQKRLDCVFLMLLIYPIYNLILVIKQKNRLKFFWIIILMIVFIYMCPCLCYNNYITCSSI